MKPPAGHETWLDYIRADKPVSESLVRMFGLCPSDPAAPEAEHARAELAALRADLAELRTAASADPDTLKRSVRDHQRARDAAQAEAAALRARLAEAEQLLKPLHAMCELWVPEYCSTAAGFRARAALSAQEPRA